jgi:hypothetical protein
VPVRPPEEGVFAYLAHDGGEHLLDAGVEPLVSACPAARLTALVSMYSHLASAASFIPSVLCTSR